MKGKGKQVQQIAKKKAVMKHTKRRPVNVAEGISKWKRKGGKARESKDDTDYKGGETEESEDESGGKINVGLCTKEAKILMKKIRKQTTRTAKIMADVKEIKRRQVKQEVVLNKILRFVRDLTRHQMNRNEGGMPGQEETVEEDKENVDEDNEMQKGDENHEDEDDDLSGAGMQEKNQKGNNTNGGKDVEQPEGVVEEEQNRERDKSITEELNAEEADDIVVQEENREGDASEDTNGRQHVEKGKPIVQQDDMPNFDIFSFQTQPEVEGRPKENEGSTEGKEEREKNEMNTEKEQDADMWGMGSQEDSQFVKEVCKNVEEVEEVALQSTD
ncbi:unnamed protein product [Cuscuta epithymum]|uniref:Glutamic acid-rich protein-like n=1 Tax=Cuscuta epithymum TaxID=186058 RepID=A0AAV0EJE9_9ASTE|nr:unnamed protein product [Cuscuta epithymum]